MKGFQLERNFILILIITLVLLGIAVLITSTSVAEPAKKQSLLVAINRLCPDWVALNCDANAAESKLFIDYEGKTTSLADLCKDDFGSNNWQETYPHCLKQCIGCPQE